MNFLPIELEKAMDLSEADPKQAAIVLRIAAEYLKNGEKMPFTLALFLADAFDRAMRMAPSVRSSELLINLKLKANNRRKVAANFEHVGRDIEKCIASKMSITDSVLETSERYGISDSTVSRLYKKYNEFKAAELVQDALLFEDEFLHQQKLSSNRSKKSKK